MRTIQNFELTNPKNYKQYQDFIHTSHRKPNLDPNVLCRIPLLQHTPVFRAWIQVRNKFVTISSGLTVNFLFLFCHWLTLLATSRQKTCIKSSYPCSSVKSFVQSIFDITSSTPTNSASVLLLVFIFCFAEPDCNAPVPIVIILPV